jgi:hypothetical protein
MQTVIRIPATPQTPSQTVVVPANDAAMADLQARSQALTDQLTVLIGDKSGLSAQMRLVRGPERANLAGQLRQVDQQIAQVSGELANVRAQIQTRETGITLAPPAFPPVNTRRQFDPDFAAGLMFAFIFAVLMPISIAYARRIWRGKPRDAGPPPADAVSASRLERLEQSVDSIAIEIERISEGQRFVTKVLAERMPIGKPGAAEPQAAELRAIGAGPIEPIRAPDRQAVRQSVTPH